MNSSAMVETIRIINVGTCQYCENTPPEKECLQCFTCQTQVHELCDNLDNDRKLWTNTCFDKEQFFCDKCLTNIEIILAGSESQKINTLEKKVDNMENKLDEITTLLKSSKTVSDSSHKMSATQSIWYDKNTLASIKSPSEKAVLVVKSTQNATTNENNKTKVEKAIMENNIPVSQSYKSRSDDIVVVCESKDTRDESNHLVASDNEEIVLGTPQGRRPSITIVGLPRECTKEEVVQMLEMQNDFIYNSIK